MSTHTIDREAITAEARQKWQRDPQLRHEFCHDVDTYIAWCIADAQGLSKILGRQAVDGRE